MLRKVQIILMRARALLLLCRHFVHLRLQAATARDTEVVWEQDMPTLAVAAAAMLAQCRVAAHVAVVEAMRVT